MCLVKESFDLELEEVMNTKGEIISKGDYVFFLNPAYPNFFVSREVLEHFIWKNGIGPFYVYSIRDRSKFDYVCLEIVIKKSKHIFLEIDFFTKKDDAKNYFSETFISNKEKFLN